MSKDAFFSALLREAVKKRRKENIITVVPEGAFKGNTKAAFLIMSRIIERKKSNWKICFIGSDGDKKKASELGFYALSRDSDSYEAADLYTRASYSIFGTHNFQQENNWFWQACRSSSVKVQLWHGVSTVKKVSYEVERAFNVTDPCRYSEAASDAFSYDYFVTPSPRVSEIFRNAFPCSTFLSIGYPRVDLLIREDYEDLLFVGFNKDLLNKINDLKKEMKTILLCPTKQDPGFPDEKFAIWADLAYELVKKGNIGVLVKMHPQQNDKPLLETLKQIEATYKNLVIIDKMEDIYPLMKLADLMVVDYSSAAQDFVVLDKPIVYFRPAHEIYLKNIGGSEDAFSVGLGPVFTEISHCVNYICDNKDGFKDNFSVKRQKLARELHVNYTTGMATEVLFDFLTTRV